MYKLYTRPGSGGFVVEAALALANAPFEKIDVPKTEQTRPRLPRHKPAQPGAGADLAGRQHNDGIGGDLHTARRDVTPEARLAPAVDAPARADFLRWMAFMSAALYAGHAAALLRAIVIRPMPMPPRRSRRRRSPRWIVASPVIDAALAGPRLAGRRTQLSLADIYLVMLVAWHPDPEKARGRVAEHRTPVWSTLRAHPLMKRLNASHEMWPA